MNQPDLSFKVSKLRQGKHLPQEQLAEYCDVSKRAIQRIESGEVELRSFTQNNLSNILEFDFGKDNTEAVVNTVRALSEKPVRYALRFPFVK